MMHLVIKAKELLKTNSKEFVIDKLTREKTARQSISTITKAVEEASKIK